MMSVGAEQWGEALIVWQAVSPPQGSAPLKPIR
jgi:hypothetical protein